MTGAWQRAVDYLRWRASGRPVGGPDEGYDAWREAAAALHPPANPGVAISVITPVLDPPVEVLERCLASVAGQTHPDVEHVLVDAGCRLPAVRDRLAVAAREPRVRFVHAPGGIGRSTNAGVAAASGDYVAFLDHDDELHVDALAWVAACAPDADLIYTDQDELDENGQRRRPFFKPAWSPRLLWSLNYVNHLTCVRTELLHRLGGLREDIDGVQDHELLLRISRSQPVVAHVPLVLYHWRRWTGSTSADPARRAELEQAAVTCIRGTAQDAGASLTVSARRDEPFRYDLHGRSSVPVRFLGSPPDGARRWTAWLEDPRVRAVGGGSSPAGGVSADALTRFPRERGSLVGWAAVRADDAFAGEVGDLVGHGLDLVGVPSDDLPVRPGTGLEGSPHVMTGPDGVLRVDPRGPANVGTDPVRWARPSG